MFNASREYNFCDHKHDLGDIGEANKRSYDLHDAPGDGVRTKHNDATTKIGLVNEEDPFLYLANGRIPGAPKVRSSAVISSNCTVNVELYRNSKENQNNTEE